jgi:hypothetical protein
MEQSQKNKDWLIRQVGGSQARLALKPGFTNSLVCYLQLQVKSVKQASLAK